jgi:hypothetical protein
VNETTECTVTSGFIGIQSEGGEIEIRSIYFSPLKYGTGGGIVEGGQRAVHSPYSSEEMRAACERIVREKRR